MRPVDQDLFLRPAIGTASALAPGLARRFGRGDGSTPRPGWYAYRVTGAAGLPSWAAEIALTIERPVAPTEAPDEDPTGNGPAGRRPWVDRSLDPSAPEPERWARGGPAQAMVLLRAPPGLPWLDGIAEAIAEVETMAGIRRADPEDELVQADPEDELVQADPEDERLRADPEDQLIQTDPEDQLVEADLAGELVEGMHGRGPRLLTGPVLPGLAPVAAAVARAHLRIAGSRGLPGPLRRRRPASGALELAWRAGAGCVLTCDGPDGRSAQAVVGVRGTGDAAAIAPPPGGALVLRAWQASAGCGVACGLVLGASTTLGLGRSAGQVAAEARNSGWDASALTGPAAVLLARAGSPGLRAPREVARAATRAQVAALFQACLTAADIA